MQTVMETSGGQQRQVQVPVQKTRTVTEDRPITVADIAEDLDDIKKTLGLRPKVVPPPATVTTVEKDIEAIKAILDELKSKGTK